MKAIIYTMAIMSLLAIAGFFLIAVFPIIIGHVIVKYTFIEPTDPGEPLEFAIIGLLAILGTFSIFVIVMATISVTIDIWQWSKSLSYKDKKVS